MIFYPSDSLKEVQTQKRNHGMHLICQRRSWRDRRLTLPCCALSWHKASVGLELEGSVERHGCYAVGMKYAVVSDVGDRLCVAEAAAS